MRKAIELYYFLTKAHPGDCLLTASDTLCGKHIKRFQELQGDPAKYTHVVLITDDILNTDDGRDIEILEADGSLNYSPIGKYCSHDICLLRHKDMTPEKYAKGFEAIKNDIGQKYPYPRLVLHAIDNICNFFLRVFHVKLRVQTTKFIKIRGAVCSEWYAKFLCGAGILQEWRGIDPDWFDDRRQEASSPWQTIFEGRLL